MFVVFWLVLYIAWFSYHLMMNKVAQYRACSVAIRPTGDKLFFESLMTDVTVC